MSGAEKKIEGNTGVSDRIGREHWCASMCCQSDGIKRDRTGFITNTNSGKQELEGTGQASFKYKFG
jgi:hypothetical protein